MKAFELDYVARHEGREEREIEKGEIAFRVNDTCYYTVSISGDHLRIRKAGFPDDKLIVTLEGANVLSIK